MEPKTWELWTVEWLEAVIRDSGSNIIAAKTIWKAYNRLREKFSDVIKTNDQIESVSRELVSSLESELEHVKECATKVMDTLYKYGPSIVPHLLDTDDNDGQRLREAIDYQEKNSLLEVAQEYKAACIEYGFGDARTCIARKRLFETIQED